MNKKDTKAAVPKAVEPEVVEKPFIECICRATCQQRLPSGHIRFFEIGEVFPFQECPEAFEPLGGDIDFITAERDELLAARWTAKEAREAIMGEFGVELKRIADGTKIEMVDEILDIRYRALNK